MTWALIIDGAVAAYPYNEAELRAAHPGTSFPADLLQADLIDFGVFPVEHTEPPVVTSEQVAEEATPELVNGVWRQSWTVRDKTADELAAAKAAIWEKVKARRAVAIEAGCTIPGLGTFQTDADSLDNVTQGVAGALLAAATGQPFTIDWTLADNATATLSGPQMMAAGKIIGERKSACHARSRALRAQIDAAADFATLEAIDTGSGWPA